MSDKTRMLALGVLVAVLALFMVMEQGNAKKRRARRAAPPAEAAQQAEQPPAASAPATADGAEAAAASGLSGVLAKLGPRDEASVQRQLERMQLDWGRNPFEPPGEGPTSRAGLLTLRGLSVTPSGRNLAIVNETILREGELIDGNEIVRIETNQVVLQKDGREFILKLEVLE
jgi:hypothetical protein